MTNEFINNADGYYMGLAIEQAKRAVKHRDVPVGAVVVKDGKVIADGRNLKERRGIATLHAEVVAINRASKKLRSWYLDGCTLYVTLEPCAMCAGAIINARIDRLVYGTPDSRFGCCGTLYNLPEDERFNHRVEVTGGVRAEECAGLLKGFFKGLREKGRKDSG